MKAINSTQVLFSSISLVLISIICLSMPARAVTALDAQNAFNAYNAAYLVNSGGQTYYAHSVGDLASDTDWTEALSIQGAEDAYEVTGTAANQTLVNNLCSTFVINNPNPWSWDGWNDNLGWDALAMIRGYQMTGNTALLTYAENTFNQAFSRGWDTTSNGGGIWELQPADEPPGSSPNKAALSNNSNCQVALMIYQSTGNTTYLTEAEEIYNWVLANLYNSSTGEVYADVTSTGTVNTGNALYSQGTFIDVSVLLYQITGSGSYLTNAENAVTYAQNNLTVNGICSNQSPGTNTWAAEFSRGLGHLVKYDPALLATYSSFLKSNATAAWNCRRTDYNVSWNAWTKPTPTSLDVLANWDVNVVAIMEWANPPPANTYAILNNNSGMSLEPTNGGTASLTPLVQAPYTGASGELWNVSLFGPDQYSAVGVQSGLAINVDAGSTSNNAPLILYPYNAASNELFTTANQGGNFYNIDFANSGLAMTVQSASTLSGAAVVQYTPSTATNEEWSFQPVLTPGNYVLFVNSTNMCLTASSTVKDTPLVQSPYTGSPSEIWNVASLGNGQYSAIGVQSGLSINVDAGSGSNNAELILFPYNGQSNEKFTLQDASGGAGYDNIIFTNSGLAMAVENASTASGANVVQYTTSNATNEQWSFQPVTPLITSGTYSLVVNSTGMCLAPNNGATAAGTALVQSPFNGASSELWNITALGNGQYSAIGAESGLSLQVAGNSTVNDAQMDLATYTGATDELFTLQYANGGASSYNVIMVNSGLALTVLNASTTAGADIVQYTPSNATNEEWVFQPYAPVATGTYALVVDSTGMDLTTQNGATASGTLLVQSPSAGTTDDLWNITSLGNGQYSAIGVQSGLSINVINNSTANNTELQLWDYQAVSGDLFTLQATSTSGYYNVIMVNSGLAMAVAGASTTSGADIVQYTVNSGTNELWQFQPQTPAVASGTYAMLVQSTGMGLTANSNNTKDTDLFQSHFDDWNTSQQWTVTSLGNGEYSAIGVASGLSINVDADSMSTNADLILFPYNGQTNELFTLVSQGGGYYNIDMANSGLAMSIQNASTTSGANVVQYTPGTASDELWSFQLIPSGVDGWY